RDFTLELEILCESDIVVEPPMFTRDHERRNRSERSYLVNPCTGYFWQSLGNHVAELSHDFGSLVRAESRPRTMVKCSPCCCYCYVNVRVSGRSNFFDYLFIMR